jgi:hypothetical protein
VQHANEPAASAELAVEFDPASLLHEALALHAHRLGRVSFAQALAQRALDLVPCAAGAGDASDAALGSVLALLAAVVRLAPRPWAAAAAAAAADTPAASRAGTRGGGGGGGLGGAAAPALVAGLDHVCRDALAGRRSVALALTALDLAAALVEQGNAQVRKKKPVAINQRSRLRVVCKCSSRYL